MNSFFHEAVEENPIIAAVKNMDDLKICCSLEDIQVVFILFGDVCSIREIVQQIKDSGKVAMVHVVVTANSGEVRKVCNDCSLLAAEGQVDEIL